MGKEESKQVLIEELGIHLESEHNLPPLAARVFAVIVFLGGCLCNWSLPPGSVNKLCSGAGVVVV